MRIDTHLTSLILKRKIRCCSLGISHHWFIIFYYWFWNLIICYTLSLSRNNFDHTTCLSLLILLHHLPFSSFNRISQSRDIWIVLSSSKLSELTLLNKILQVFWLILIILEIRCHLILKLFNSVAIKITSTKLSSILSITNSSILALC